MPESQPKYPFYIQDPGSVRNVISVNSLTYDIFINHLDSGIGAFDEHVGLFSHTALFRLYPEALCFLKWW